MGMIFLWGSIQTWLPSSIKSSWLNPNAPVSMRFPTGASRQSARQARRLLKANAPVSMNRGKPSVRTVKRALALLKADEGLRDREIAGVLLINAATVARVRKRFVEEGLDAAINDKPRPGRERKLDGKQEAHLVAVACSSPPEGHVNWTLHLLADKVVEMELAGSISLETVRQILKKTNSSPRSATGQAVVEKGMVHPQAERGVRRPDGGRTGPRIQYGAGSLSRRV